MHSKDIIGWFCVVISILGIGGMVTYVCVQIEVEKAAAFLHLIPGAEHRDEAQKQCEKYEQQTQSVETQVKVDAELRNPIMIQLDQPVV